jgi:hypothetical protein
MIYATAKVDLPRVADNNSIFGDSYAVPDLLLCLGVLKHRARWPGGGGGSSSCQAIFFTMDFCLCGAILNLMAFCFGAIPDIMIELIVYGSVPQIIRGPLVIGKNNV